ncbi:MAG: exostosin family protein [Elainellaceae cyanobacterium]
MKEVRRIKIYSDERYLFSQDGTRPHPMLFPFWPHWAERGDEPWFAKFDTYMRIADQLFEMTSLEEADFVVMPDDWRTVSGEVWYAKMNQEAESLYLKLAHEAKQVNKPLIIFFGSDISDRKIDHIDLKSTYIFRHSGDRSNRQPRSFTWPVFGEDLIEQYCDGSFLVRKKSQKPKIGFCGFAKTPNLRNKVAEVAYQTHMLWHYRKLGEPGSKWHVLRTKLIEKLQQSPYVDTNFDVSNEMEFLDPKDPEKRNNPLKVRRRFVQNIVDSDYVLCCRGAANYSCRIFETLCCGRIPVLIDSDRPLPYDFMVDWKEYCVWIDKTETSQIAEKVADFHNQLSPTEFEELQKKCRQFWKEWISPEGFYSKLHLHFQYGDSELLSNAESSALK